MTHNSYSNELIYLLQEKIEYFWIFSHELRDSHETLLSLSYIIQGDVRPSIRPSVLPSVHPSVFPCILLSVLPSIPPPIGNQGLKFALPALNQPQSGYSPPSIQQFSLNSQISPLPQICPPDFKSAL